MTLTAAKSQSVAGVIARIFGTIGLAMTLMLAVAVMSSPAEAQTVCLAHAELVKQLSRRYAEEPMGIGLANDGTVMQLFTSKDGDTWTLVRTLPDGTSCLMAGGEAWADTTAHVIGRVS
ncbi:MAG: hypothetical protein ACE5JZ_12960 [Kiloniellales bacterium]